MTVYTPSPRNASWNRKITTAAREFGTCLRTAWHLDEDATARLMESSSWADGLRGIATLGVVASHMVLCFARRLIVPCCGPDGKTPMLFQRPILRLLAAGHSWVAIFFVLLGFVNALKPLMLARSDQCETALDNLATASFRRTFRLTLPSLFTTVLPWIICQLGLMEGARVGDAWWLYTNTPDPSSTWREAFGDLRKAILGTWSFRSGNQYNQPQWTMVHLLQGSMMVFMALVMVIKLRPVWRVRVLLLLMFWSMNWSLALGDPLVGITCFAGIMLAELSLTRFPARFTKSIWAPLVSCCAIAFALMMMSMPSAYPETAAWSLFFHDVARLYFTGAAATEYHRTWGSLGAIMLVAAVINSPHARQLLSTKPLRWLGKMSFPVFLLHPMFMQTIMPLLAFSNEVVYETTEFDEIDESGTQIIMEVGRYAQRSNAVLCIVVAGTIGCTLVAAQVWTSKLDPLFDKTTRWCENRMTSQEPMHLNVSLPTARLQGQFDGILNLPMLTKEKP